jgi:hypothetical protein
VKRLWKTVRGKCAVMVERDRRNPMSNEPCGRPAKGSIDGQPRCGIHLRDRRKPQKREE